MSRRGHAPEPRQLLAQLAEKISRLAAAVGDPALAPEAIHDIRTSSKRFRALLRMAGSSVGATRRAQLRELVKRVKDSVAAARDAHVMAGRLAAFAPHHKLEPSAAGSHAPDPAAVAALASQLEAATRAARFRAMEPGEVLDAVVGSYRRARVAAQECRAAPSDHALHQWRKRVKTLAYQLAVLPDLSPAAALEKKCRRLGTLLGDHHDCAVLLEHLASNGHAGHPALPEIRKHHKKLGNRRLAARRKIFDLPPRQFEALLRKAARPQRGGPVGLRSQSARPRAAAPASGGSLAEACQR
ncbi:MAG: CHAD domain-containing protein [Terrimicrobiaceae bacterium]|nr:CHAD domain-containing protein [Terrimicrobiaceae bacterium]